MALTASQKGLVFALLATFLFSIKPIFIKLIYAYNVDSVVLMTWRMMLSLPIYWVIGALLWRQQGLNGTRPDFLKKGLLPKVLVVGVLGYYAASLFDLWGLQTITAQLERLILFTYPALVSVFAWLLMGSPIPKSRRWALLLSYLGVALIFVKDFSIFGQSVWVGSGWVFLSAVSFSLYVLLSKPLIAQIGGRWFTVLAMTVSSVCIFVHFGLQFSPHEIAVPLGSLWLIALMVVFATVIPSFLIAEAIALLGPEKTAISGSIGPIVTSLLAVALLGEHFSWAHLVGLALVISAVRVMQDKDLFAKKQRDGL